MKSRNISLLLALASLPFFASCAAWNTAEISVGLHHHSLTYVQAKKAIENGANVKDAWAGECFVERAAHQKRFDLVKLFIEEGGASAFDAPGGYKRAPFSLFKFAYEKKDADLMIYCLKHPDVSSEPMHTQVHEVAKKLFERMREPGMARWAGERNSEMLEAILQSGILSESEAENLSPERAKQIATQDLFNALERGDSSEADRCIKQGADVNAKNANGDSVLYAALKSKNGSSLRSVLLDAGATLRPEEATEILAEAVTGRLEFDVPTLIQWGADVNAKGANGDPVLCMFLKSVNVDGARSRENGTKILFELIKAGADVNATSVDGHSPLYLAHLKSNEWCKTLIASGIIKIDSGRKFDSGTELLPVTVNGKSTYIVSASEATQCLVSTMKAERIPLIDSRAKLLPAEATEILAKMVNGESTYIDVDAPTLIQWGAVPVFAAEATQCLVSTVRNGKIRNGLSIELLQQWGANVNVMVKDFSGKEESLLYYAIANCKNSEIIAALKRAGAKMTPTEIEEEGSPDGLAAMIGTGNAEGLRRLFAEGVDPNTKIKDDESGEESSLLATAIVWHNMKINPDARGVFERLPEKEEKRNAILALLSTTNEEKTRAVIKVIKDAGGKITAEEKKELSLWKLDEMLRSYEWKKIAKAVTEGEIDLSAESNGVNGFHLLADATKSIDSSFINALLNAGADINGKTKQGKRSPLAVAIANMNADAVELFLRHGANPNDSIPLSGAFGDAGTKSLMDIAIEIYNQAVERRNSAVARRNNLTSAGTPNMTKKYVRTGRNSGYWTDDVGRYNEDQRRLNKNFENEIRERNAAIEEANETVRIAKKIVSLMAQATGTELTNL